MLPEIHNILQVIQLAEKLKSELRHSWISSGRQESVAEHSWLMSLMAILIHPHLKHPVDLSKTLQMIIIHDLVEAEAGDVCYFDTQVSKAEKQQNEQKAIENIRAMLNNQTGQTIYELWQEFEVNQTNEARFAKAIDNLEVQLQHNFADFSTWETIEYDLVYTKMDQYCEHDSFLMDFCQAVKCQAEEKMQSHGIQVDTIKEKLDIN